MTSRSELSTRRLVIVLLLIVATGRSARAQQRIEIRFAEGPARLVRIDGEPIYRPIAGTDLQRVGNTSALIVRDSAGVHCLKVLDGWMESYSLTGDWGVSGRSPFGDQMAIEQLAIASTADTLDGRGALADNPPTILVATVPTALIVTDGPPRFETVAGTALEYVVNTSATVFRELQDQKVYVQVDDDWYRARTIDGPWEFIPLPQLPADIARQVAR